MLRIDNSYQINGNELLAGLTSSRDDRAISTSMKILVVEDNLLNQKVARIFLEDMDYQVEIAASGKEALAMFDGSYSLILMDVGLPDIDGIEITQKIRERETNTHIPIIACTANGNIYRSKCLEAGMDGFILKPIMLDELKQILDIFLTSNCKL
jgi:CheY-like chemotaxis protein